MATVEMVAQSQVQPVKRSRLPTIEDVFYWAAGITSLMFTAGLGLALYMELPWFVVPLTTLGGIGLGGTAGFLFTSAERRFIREQEQLRETHREQMRLLWLQEVILKRDLDHNGFEGDPQNGVRVSAQAPEQPNAPVSYEADHKDFEDFVRKSLGRNSARFREWNGQPLPSGRPVDFKIWNTYCARLIDLGCAHRMSVNPRATIVFDKPAEEILEMWGFA
jgi:hypothetical protein